LSYTPHPLVELADRHLDATLDRLDKSTQTFWEGQAEFGRSVTKLSSAALILSVSVAQFFILKAAVTTWNILLPTAWILFGIAIILGAGHHSWLGAANLGRLHFELKRSQIRAAVAVLDLDATDLSAQFDAILMGAAKEAETETVGHLKTYKWRSLVMFWSFAIGVGLLVTFAIRNLHI
jgi:hypothetical protein